MFSSCCCKAGIGGMDLACIKSCIEQPGILDAIIIRVFAC